MKITGILPVRNCIENGYPFMESILSVLPIVDEYLVCDGGSTDGTLEALEKLEASYPKVRLLRIPDLPENVRWDSCSVQSNEMIKQAKGEWIFLGNADELVHEDDALAIRNFILKSTDRCLRFQRREITHNWSGLSQEVYEPGRLARKEKGLRMNWNAYGGDEFLYDDGWFDPKRKIVMPFTLYHLCNMFPLNYVQKLRHDAEYISPGDKQRVRIYNNMIGAKMGPVKLKEVYPNLPALAKGLLGLPEYRVREELLDKEWVKKETGLIYG